MKQHSLPRRLSIDRALICLFGAALTFACGPKPSSEPAGRGILVIAIDALRADHLSSFGYDRPTTPTLDSLAKQGTSFVQAWSTAPEIVPAHVSLLTGCDPTLAHRSTLSDEAPLSSWYIPAELPHLAQEYLSHGYATAAFVDHPSISPAYGFGAGFQDFYGFRSAAVLPQMEYGFEGVASKFLNWLTKQDKAQDWFAYVHINDLERVWRRPDPDPSWDTFFEPRPELNQVPPVAEADRVFFAVPRTRWSGATMTLGEYEARYDGALGRLDNRLGRMLERMRLNGRLKNTIVVIVGTYGVGFGETGLYLDSGTLSDADLHVPLIVRPPLAMKGVRGDQSKALASLVDVAPTLLEMSQIPVPKGMQGVSLVGALRGESNAAREFAFASGGLQNGFAVIDLVHCYEWSSPATAHSPLALSALSASALSISWYGDELDHHDEHRSYLHDRVRRPSAGHLGASADEPVVAALMHAAGVEWFDWVGRARDILQRVPNPAREDDAAMIDELRKRGLLGEKR